MKITIRLYTEAEGWSSHQSSPVFAHVSFSTPLKASGRKKKEEREVTAQIQWSQKLTTTIRRPSTSDPKRTTARTPPSPLLRNLGSWAGGGTPRPPAAASFRRRAAASSPWSPQPRPPPASWHQGSSSRPLLCWRTNPKGACCTRRSASSSSSSKEAFWTSTSSSSPTCTGAHG